VSQILELSVGKLDPLPAEAHAEIIRELSASDIDLLEGHRGITAPLVKKLRDSHHRLARLLAQGLKQVEVSAITGYSQSRISILQQDPAFRELIEHYREVETSAFADIPQQLVALSADVLGELRDRLEDSPDAFTNKALMSLLNSLLDRTGHGPKTKHERVSICVTGEDLARLKQLAKESQIGYVTDRIIAAQRTEDVPENPGTILGEVIPLRAEGAQEETQGLAGEGDNL
jgi:hypothetical protein